MIIQNNFNNYSILDEHLVIRNDSIGNIPLLESSNENKYNVEYKYIENLMESYGYEIDEVTARYFIKSNRTQSNEDGSFTISSTVESETFSVEYRFIDAERNTMEAKVKFIDETESGDSSQSEGTENSDVVIMKKLIDHEIKINADILVPAI